MNDEIGIGSRVRTARDRRRLSREALAFHSGVSWSAIAQVESGRRRNLRPSTLSALAAALGVSVDYLVSGRGGQPILEHRAWFYSTDAEFQATAAPLLADAVERSEAVLAVIGAGQIAALKDQLGPRAGKVRFVDRTQWYTTPAGTLGGYREFVSASLLEGAPWVRIIGEPVWAGRSAQEAVSWCRYEALLNLVFAAAPISVFCPYDRRTIDEDIVRQAHATHPHTIEGDQSTPSPTYADPGDFVLRP
jgi:transcriptional regulator with XRE-family HTH domain